MKIYLDMCSLQRPLDTKTQVRVVMEAEAMLNILALCESGYAELLTSDTLVFETEQNPHPVRKQYVFGVLAMAKQFILTDSQVEARARAFHATGIKPLDALHLASAVAARADYLCTCDDQFLRRAKATDTRPTQVVSPLELVTEITR
jgi:predicted nucleic acid-binding protein